MSPADVRVAALRAEVERDWRQVERHSVIAASVDPARGAPEAALVALALDHGYQAFEQLLLRLEAALGLPERSGQHWHRRLLADATLELPGVRPSVIPTSLERDWEELLSFRHFLRHAYAVELDAERLRTNVQRLQRAVAGTAPTMNTLLAALAADLGA